MKTLKMVYLGTDTDCVTSGKEYVIKSKTFEGGYYTYVFMNDNNEEDSAASFLFTKACEGKYENFKNALNR